MTKETENKLFQLYRDELGRIYTQEPNSTAFERAKEQLETFESEVAKLQNPEPEKTVD